MKTIEATVSGSLILKIISSFSNKEVLRITNIFFPEYIDSDKWYSVYYFKSFLTTLSKMNLYSQYELGILFVKNIKFNSTAIDFVRGCVFFNYINRQLHTQSLLNNYLDVIAFDKDLKKYKIKYASVYSDDFLKGVIVGIMLKYRYDINNFKIEMCDGVIDIEFIGSDIKYVYGNSKLHMQPF